MVGAARRAPPDGARLQDRRDPPHDFRRVARTGQLVMRDRIGHEEIEEASRSHLPKPPSRLSTTHCRWSRWNRDSLLAAPNPFQSAVCFAANGGDGTAGSVQRRGPGDWSGWSVSNAGDVNGDGFDDLIVGAPCGRSAGGTAPGASYVVFGKAGGFRARTSISRRSTAANGFKLSGVAAGDDSGIGRRAGDVNGDGFDDLIVGALRCRSATASDPARATWCSARPAGFAASLDLSTLDGSNGFRLNGVAAGDQSGNSVDLGGRRQRRRLRRPDRRRVLRRPARRSDAGESYVVFGKAGGFRASSTSRRSTARNGFVLHGAARGDRSRHLGASRATSTATASTT